MELEAFLDYDKFKQTFGNQNSIKDILEATGKVVDNMLQEELLDLINKQTGKWPHNLIREDLTTACKRMIQRKFYEQLYGKKPSQDIIDRDEHFMKILNLQDTFPEKPKPKEKKASIPKPPKPPKPPMSPMSPISPSPKPLQEPKPKKSVSEFGQKVINMNLEQLIAWALELGVPQERIDKHKDKSLGLAKMNISNLIRPKLPKEEPKEEPLDEAAKTSIEDITKGSDSASDTKIARTDDVW